MTPEAFDRWLAEGQERAPRLYGGKIVHPVVLGHEPNAKANVVSLDGVEKHVAKPWGGQERLDWAQRAANDRESREVPAKPGIPEDWDGREES